MDLRKRLARFDKQHRPGSQTGVRSALPDTGPDPDALAALGFAPLATDSGEAWVLDAVFPDCIPVVLPEAAAAGPGLSAFLTAAVPADIRVTDLLFLDTETTGLAGGAGTVAFLVGLAWWGSGGLNIRQIFLPTPGGEPALLAALAESVADFRVLVTYNGNAYDLPLLRSRGILSRRRNLLGDALSWDLLPAARRMWGRGLPDCRQQSVERVTADTGRPAGDIEGSRIPQIWFDFVRGEASGEMSAVVDHNRYDLLGMTAILGALATRAASLEPTAADSGLAWTECWSLARICERAGLRRAAADWIVHARRVRERDRAAAREDPRREAFDRDSVRLLKRVAAWPVVDTILRRFLESCPASPWALRDAAILLEHRAVDLPAALDLAVRLGEEKRIARIEHKLGRLAAE